MQEKRRQLFQALQGDETLLNMLAKNVPFWNDTLASEAKYSIMPADKLSNGMTGPLITLQFLGENRLSDHLLDAFVVIRCYNNSDKTFVVIDDVLDRVKTILDDVLLEQDADKAVSIKVRYESTGAELRDETFDMNFRESQYRLMYL